MDLTALEERLGYHFTSAALLEQAVTHRSHGAVHNERLEFLGDAVLNCTIAQLLYQKYARLNEGDLSRLRANLVKQSSLADIAERISLSDYLRLGEGEMKSGGFRRPSILADTMEAIFGAVLVDGGFEAGSGVIARLFEPVLKHVDPKTLGKDSKTLLQEYLQGKRLPLPLYTVVETRGAAHNQEFEVECAIPKLEVSVRGSGRSRRAAEQTAAKLAFDMAHAAMTAARRAKKKSAPASDGEPQESTGAESAAKKSEPADVASEKPREKATDVASPRAASRSTEARLPAPAAGETAVERVGATSTDVPPSKEGSGTGSGEKSREKAADGATPRPVTRSAETRAPAAAEVEPPGDQAEPVGRPS